MIKRALSVFTVAAAAFAAKVKNENNYLEIHEFEAVERFTGAAKYAFIERQGLADLDEFVHRKDIIDTSWELAIIEFNNPEDMKEFLGSMGRIAIAVKDYVELTMQIKNSDNFQIIKKRVFATSTAEYLKKIFMSYGDVSVLFYD